MNTNKQHKGFTLLELIVVIIILGIMSAGISGFISLSTQTYVNATTRDELVGNARFLIERLNRELRNALPNSIRISEWGSGENITQCLQFTPIVASTTYLDIPVSPEPASKVLSVVPFVDVFGNSYNHTALDLVTVYPLITNDIYTNSQPISAMGKTFLIDSVTSSSTPWQINIDNSQDVHFLEDSPTQRLYIIREQVSYCNAYVVAEDVWTIVRFSDFIESGTQSYPSSTRQFMAGYLNSGQTPFNYEPATLQRNAVVQINFHFTKDSEKYVFDHEIHINNVP